MALGHQRSGNLAVAVIDGSRDRPRPVVLRDDVLDPPIEHVVEDLLDTWQVRCGQIVGDAGSIGKPVGIQCTDCGEVNQVHVVDELANFRDQVLDPDPCYPFIVL